MADRHTGHGLAGRAQPILAVGNSQKLGISAEVVDPGRFAKRPESGLGQIQGIWRCSEVTTVGGFSTGNDGSLDLP